MKTNFFDYYSMENAVLDDEKKFDCLAFEVYKKSEYGYFNESTKLNER